MSIPTYDVVPNAEVWIVRLQGDSVSEVYGAKADAITRARQLAQRDVGRMRVLTAGGDVEAEYDPSAGVREAERRRERG